MRLATSIDTNQPIDAVIASVRAARDAGFATAWSSQIFGADALTVFAVVAREVDGIQFGTAVIPVHPRHPQVLAQQALTVQAISNGRLPLGIRQSCFGIATQDVDLRQNFVKGSAVGQQCDGIADCRFSLVEPAQRHQIPGKVLVEN